MLRFVDLTDDYGIDEPCCAFLSTYDDRFVTNEDGMHVFDGIDEIMEHRFARRMLILMPERFFRD